MFRAFLTGAGVAALLDAVLGLPIAPVRGLWREYGLVALASTVGVALLAGLALELATRLPFMRGLRKRLQGGGAFWPGLALGLLPVLSEWLPILSARRVDHRLIFLGWCLMVALVALPAPWLVRKIGPSAAFCRRGALIGPLGLLVFWLLPVGLPEGPPPPKPLPPALADLAPADGRPDLVLISIDTLRTDLNRAGMPLMPYLLELQAQGVWSEYGLSGANQTVPGHLSMLSGLAMQQHGLAENKHGDEEADGTFPIAHQTLLAEYLKSGGYRTAAVVSNGMIPGRKGWADGYDVYDDSRADYGDRFFFMRRVGTSGWIEALLGGRTAQDLLAGYLGIQEQEILPPGMGRAVTDQALIYHQGLCQSEAPAHLFVHFMDPHSPYTPPEETRGRFTAESELPPSLRAYEHEHHRLINRIRDSFQAGDESSVAEARQGADYLRRLYDEEVQYMDSELRRLVAGLAMRGRPTLVMLTSDHGEYFGEHQGMEHSTMLWEPVLRVPFVAFGLNGFAVTPRQLPSPAHIEDVVPTMLAAAGLAAENAAESGLAGVDVLGNYPEEERFHVARWRTVLAVRKGNWKLIGEAVSRGKVQPMALYDLKMDPGEEHDLEPTQPPQLDALAERWHEALAILVSNGGFIHSNQGDERDQALMEALGYLTLTGSHLVAPPESFVEEK